MRKNVLMLVMLLLFAEMGVALPASHHHNGKNRHHKLHEAGWVGAGFAAGKAIGPAGSAAVGVTRYRNDLKTGGHKRVRAITKIGGPIAAGIVAGPIGSAAYAAVEHRHWIK